jgi:hypothetical protein
MELEEQQRLQSEYEKVQPVSKKAGWVHLAILPTFLTIAENSLFPSEPLKHGELEDDTTRAEIQPGLARQEECERERM